jgi:hypothetical protein
MRRSLRILAAVFAASLAAAANAAVLFNFPNFSNCSTLQLNGNAACTGGVLRVTPATFSQAGSVFSQTIVPLGAGNSFSTFFTFRMSNNGGSADGDGLGADGITFTVQPNSNTAGGAGGGIGYQGILNSVAVEFDTWNNGAGLGDPNGNHVGIDLNGSIVSVVTAPIATRMNDGNVWYAWIDYDGTTLEVRLSQTNARPPNATLSRAVNLATVLGTTQAFVGFTSGTGSAFADHDITSWVFDNSFAPIGGTPQPLGPTDIPTLSQWMLMLAALLLGTLGMMALRRR